MKAILDLTDEDVRRQNGISESSLAGGDLNITRAIAAGARERGYAALLVPSAAAPTSENLVIFLDKLPTRPDVLSSKPIKIAP